MKSAASPANTVVTEGDSNELQQTQESEASEEERLPSFQVIFGKAGIEVICFKMNSIPLNQVERAQHLAFRQIMVDRQREMQDKRALERKGE